MKAQAVLYLPDGLSIKVGESPDAVISVFQRMQHSHPGTIVPLTRVTDHGTVKRVFIPIGGIVRIEDA